MPGQKHFNPQISRTPLYAIVVILLAAVFIFSVALDKEAVTQNFRITAGVPDSPANVTEIRYEDETSPSGVVRVFTFTLENNCDGDYLMFYIHNSWVTVSIGDEIVFEKIGSMDSPAKSGVGGQWVMTPIRQSDTGKTCTVTLTPVYRYSVENTVTFYLGDPQQLMLYSMKRNTVAIVSCLICLIVGIFYIILACAGKYTSRKRFAALGWLGLTAILMALWRILDLRAFSFFAPSRSALQYFLSLSCLALAPVSACLYERVFLRKILSGRFLDVLTLIMTLLCGCQFLLQIFGIMTLRDTLPLTHCNIAAAYLVLVAEPILNWKKTRRQPAILLMPALLISGVVLDLFVFYRDSLSQSIALSLFSMAIYTIVSGMRYVHEAEEAGYIDALTGLDNQKRCLDVQASMDPKRSRPCVVMMDLNGLKRVNDNMGHAAGNQYIIGFAKILRKTVRKSDYVFRTGGDEFAAILKKTDREQAESFRERLEKGITEWNAAHPGFDMSAAIGMVGSEEYPDSSLPELMHIADQRMYSAKNEWYEQTGAERRKV